MFTSLELRFDNQINKRYFLFLLLLKNIFGMSKMYLSEVIKEGIKHGVCRKRNDIKLNNMSI